MPAITIRDVPEIVRDELAARAARRGQSLQAYLQELLADSALNPHPDDDLVTIRAKVRARGGGRLTIQQILDAKDADRR
jgi:cytochrome P450